MTRLDYAIVGVIALIVIVLLMNFGPRTQPGDTKKQEAFCRQMGGMVLRTQSGIFCWTELK